MKNVLKVFSLFLLVCGIFWVSIHFKVGRGDEFFSMFNSSGVDWPDYLTANFQGASHSLVHAILLKAFSIGTLIDARFLSVGIFILGLTSWFAAFRKMGVSFNAICCGLFFFSTSNAGIFLATDGQFHGLVFAFSGLFYWVFVSEFQYFLKYFLLSLLSVIGFFFGADWMLLLPLLWIAELLGEQKKSAKRWLLLGSLGLFSIGSFVFFKSELLLPKWNDVIVTKSDRSFFDGIVLHFKGALNSVPILALIVGAIAFAFKRKVASSSLEKLMIAYICLRFLIVLAGLIPGIDNQLPARYFAAIDVIPSLFLGGLLTDWLSDLKYKKIATLVFIGLMVAIQVFWVMRNGSLDFGFHKRGFSKLSDRQISEWVERNKVYSYYDSLHVLNDGSRRSRYFTLWHSIHPSAPLKFCSPIEFESKFRSNLVEP